MSNLVLSLFPGLDAFGLAFELEGFCVCSGPDLIFGRDVRTFDPPPGKFDGLILSDPCQAHSSLANLVRAKGLEPSFPDMTPECVRLVEAAQPEWFLRENVPRAPDMRPAGYDVRNFMLDHSTLDRGDDWGHEQMRKRRFWFGVRGAPGACPELRQWLDFALFILPDRAVAVGAGHDYIDGSEPIGRYRERGVVHDDVQALGSGGRPRRRRAVDGSDGAEPIGRYRRQAVTHCADPVPVKLGGSGRVKSSLVGPGKPAPVQRAGAGGCEGIVAKGRAASVTGRHTPHGMGGTPGITPGNNAGNPPRYSLAEMLVLQGLPPGFLDHCPWTMQGKRKAIGNCVPVGLGRALARAIQRWKEKEDGATRKPLQART